MELLFRQFVNERKYLKNVTPATEVWYWASWKGLGCEVLKGATESPSKAVWASQIARKRGSGLSAVTVNTYARAINAFLKWAFDEGHISKAVRIPRLKEEQKVLATLSKQQVKALIAFRPTVMGERRLHAMAAMMLDNGIRANEALSLERAAVDLDNLLITVTGKGRKERKVPMSLEARKILYRWLSRHNHPLVFPTLGGTKQTQRNALRAFKVLGKRIGIEGVRFSFHTLRHTFAASYLIRGGNLFYLSRILGHADIQTTQAYLKSIGVEELQAVHQGFSPLGS